MGILAVQIYKKSVQIKSKVYKITVKLMSTFLFIFKGIKINFRKRENDELFVMVPNNTSEKKVTKNLDLY